MCAYLDVVCEARYAVVKEHGEAVLNLQNGLSLLQGFFSGHLIGQRELKLCCLEL